jgi:DNA-directed RNA polymerase specialized sigma24 family protein
MSEPELAPQPETLLNQWLQEADTNRAAALLESLIGRHAEPLVRRIVSFKLASVRSRAGGGIQQADIDDVCGVALCNLLARLEHLKYGENQAAVQKFSGYVAVTAYNACNEYFRAQKPAWLSLAMKMRYLLTHSAGLALWENVDGKEVCGFSRSRGREPVSDLGPLNDARTGLRQSKDPSRLSLSDLTEAILHASGGPLVFETLVEVAADWSGLKETRLQSLDEDVGESTKPWEQVPDRQPAPDAQLIARHYIECLWMAICGLPLPHRRALLLNLNDAAGGDIQLFDHLGVASVEQIAKALDMAPLDFAELWNELPLDDARIARDLGISRQDVANRRSAARKMLARSMREVSRGN